MIIFRKKHHKINYSLAKQVLDQGAVCLVDLLRTFAAQLKKRDHIGSKEEFGDARQKSQRKNLSEIFSETDQKLLFTILQAIHTFGACSCENGLTCLETLVEKKLSSDEILLDSDDEEDSESDLQMQYKEAFITHVSPIMRHIRITMYNAGVIDSLVPFLGWELCDSILVCVIMNPQYGLLCSHDACIE